MSGAEDSGLKAVVAWLIGSEGPGVRFADEISERRVEYDAVVELLLVHPSAGIDPGELEAVARAVAAGCLGQRHLWRDLDLPDRATLRLLLETYFGPLAVENTRDMRWKKFIYRKVCRWGGFHTCAAPSCGECSSYEECFGGEA